MRRLTIKNLLSHKLRLLATSIAVMLGVAFVVGSLGLAATLNKVFDSVFDGAYANIDVVVRGQEKAVSDNDFENTQALPNDAVARIRGVDGVAEVRGIAEFTAQVVGTDGKPVGGNGPPAAGSNWGGASFDTYRVVEGRAPSKSGEVVVNKATADDAKVKVGDTITVLTSEMPIKVTLVGIAKFGDLDSASGSSVTFFTDEQAFALQGNDEYTEIDVAGVDGVSDTVLRDRIGQALGSDFDVMTGKQAADRDADTLKDGLKFISIIPLVFGIISLVVSAFIINNVFAILLAQRTREMALLRAIGARRRQVLSSIVLESFIVGLLSSLLGLAAGIGLAAGLTAALKQLVADFPTTGLVIDAQMIVTGLVSGVGITMVAAILPAIRASKVPPLAALREVSVDRSAASRGRIAFGTLVLVAAIALLCVGFFADIKPVWTVCGGLFAVVLAFYVLGPIYVKYLVAVLGWPAAKFRGVSGVLARQNAMRNPRRTAASSAALMIGVTVVAFFVVFISSLQATAGNLVDRVVGGDFIVSNTVNQGAGTLDAAMIKQLDDLPETRAVAGFGATRVGFGDTTDSATVVDPSVLGSLFKLPFSQGSLTAVDASSFAAYKDIAKNNGWTIGQTVKFTFPDDKTAELRLAGIYDDDTLTGSLLLNQQTVISATGASPVYSLLVGKAENASTDLTRAALERVTDPYITVVVQDQAELRDQVQSTLSVVLNLILALLALAIVIALFGIAVTLALSVFERTREIGLLRAVGMTRRQTRTMVRWESVTLSLVGTLLGLLLGVGVASGVVYALRDEGIDTLSIPFVQLVIAGLVAVLAGFVTALYPARRASRLKVLQAISAE